jgi:hypothetical protein
MMVKRQQKMSEYVWMNATWSEIIFLAVTKIIGNLLGAVFG